MKSVVENGKLTEALTVVERISRECNLLGLAEWCEKELNGYGYGITCPTSYPNYRFVERNKFDLPNTIGGLASFHNELYEEVRLFVTSGIRQLEPHFELGKGIDVSPIMWPLDLDLKLMSGFISDLEVKQIMKGTRVELVEKSKIIKPRMIQAIKNPILYPPPNFNRLIKNADLSKVLEERWKEANITLKHGAPLATIVLLGSILEGILLAQAKQNISDANSSTSAPKDKKSQKVKKLEDWTLNDLIQVAHERGWIGKDANAFSKALCNYRNLIHPNQQVKENEYPKPRTCELSWGVVNAVIADLEALHTSSKRNNTNKL